MAKFMGVDIAKILNKAMGPLVNEGKLTRVTQTTRKAGESTQGRRPSDQVFPCRGFFDTTEKTQIGGTLVEQGDRVALVLGDSLPTGVTPKPNDEIEFESERGKVAAVGRDPASATYECLVRG